MPRRSPAFVLLHVVWSTFNRWPLLPARFDDVLGAMLGRRARDVGSVVLVTGVASDHVHVLLRLSPSCSLADAVQRLKGSTAHEANQRNLLGHRLVWQAGYWAESIAPHDAPLLTNYLRAQRTHHDDSHPTERWQRDAEGEPAEGGL